MSLEVVVQQALQKDPLEVLQNDETNLKILKIFKDYTDFF